MEAAADKLNLSSVIDAADETRLRRVFLLCGAVLFVAGFNSAALGNAAVGFARDYELSASEFGNAQGATRVGLLAGTVLFAMLGDRTGRRPALVAGMCLLAAATLLMPFFGVQVILRFVAGIGMGSMIPNATVLVCEYSSRQKRITNVMLVTLAFTVGVACGAPVSAWLESFAGWRLLLLVAGLASVAMAISMIRRLPESLQFLVVRGQSHRVGKWLNRIAAVPSIEGPSRFTVFEARLQGPPIGQMFLDGRATTTALFWAANVGNHLHLYVLLGLLPAVLGRSGVSDSTALSFNTLRMAGSLLGTIGLAWLMARYAVVPALTRSFGVGGVATALVSVQLVLTSPSVLTLFLFVIFAGVLGGQQGLNAVVADSHPTYMRATALGMGLALGQFAGMVLGPSIVRLLDWANPTLPLTAALPAVISVLAMVRLHDATKRRPTQTAASLELFDEYEPVNRLPVGTDVRLQEVVAGNRAGVISALEPGRYQVEFQDGARSWIDAHLVVSASDARLITIAKRMGISVFVLGGAWWGFLAAYLLLNPYARGEQEGIVVVTAGLTVILLFLPTMVVTAMARCRNQTSAWLNELGMGVVFLAMMAAVWAELFGRYLVR